MNMKRTLGMAVATMIFATPFAVLAETGGDWLQLKNRLRIEYDDNIYDAGSDEQDSIKIILQPELHVNLSLQESTFLGLRYRPSFFYWDDREPEDTDIHHDLDVVLNHRFGPRTKMAFKNTLRIAERPELIDRDVRIQDNDDYLYNVTDGSLEHYLAPNTFTRFAGRYTLIQYDNDETALREDYDIVAVGFSVGFRPTPPTTLLADYRFEDTDYDTGDRGADTHYAGLGLEHTFNPGLIGSVRAGLQSKNFDSDNISDAEDPYFDASMTYLPSPRTRLTAGLGYAMTEADVYPFASQDRMQFFASAAHDLTAKIGLNLAGSFSQGEYSGSQVIFTQAGDTFPDGDEEIIQLSARVSYMINRSNWIEFGYQYVDLSSDFRDDFDRTRISLGWRTNL